MISRCLLRLILMALCTHVSGAPLVCPGSRGLCSWSEQRGWQELWNSGERFVDSHWIAKDGSIVVNVRPIHVGAGAFVVLSRDYHEMFVGESSGGLEWYSGQAPSGAIILCLKSPPFCDTPLALKSAEKPESVPAFPKYCRFPRFLRDGAAVCALGPTLMKESADSSFVPIVGIPDLIVIQDIVSHGDGLLIWTVDCLSYWEEARSLSRIDIEPFDIEWLRAYHPITFIATRTQLLRLTKDLALEVVWSDEEMLPMFLTETGPGEFLLDVRGLERRRLLRLSLDGDRVVTETVWEAEVPLRPSNDPGTRE